MCLHFINITLSSSKHLTVKYFAKMVTTQIYNEMGLKPTNEIKLSTT